MYYKEYMNGLQRFRGELKRPAAKRRWKQTYHRAGQTAFETKIAFDYARLKIMYPSILGEILRASNKIEQSEAIINRDAQLVDRFTNAFDGFFRFDPGKKPLAKYPSENHPFNPEVGKLIVNEFKIKYPKDITVDDLKEIMQDPIWSKGARLCQLIQREVDNREERIEGSTFALVDVWKEIADALEANQRKVRNISSIVSKVSLGLVGTGLAARTGQWEPIEYMANQQERVERYVEDKFSGILKIRRPVHYAAAWEYKVLLDKKIARRRL